MDLGPLEIIVVLAVVIMIFGVGKLPEIGSALGKGIREFRSATREEDVTPNDTGQAPHASVSSAPGNCANCGAAISPDVRFCTSCGQSLSA